MSGTHRRGHPAHVRGASLRPVTEPGCTTTAFPRRRSHPVDPVGGAAPDRVGRVAALRRQLAGVLHCLDAVILPPELTDAAAGARQWLEEVTPADPLDPAPAFVRSLEHTVRITQQLLARHTVAATYVHLDAERPPWPEHQHLEDVSASYCQHVGVRQHDVAVPSWPLEQRPGFARLRGDIEEGRVQLLVVRSAADLVPAGLSPADHQRAAEAMRGWLQQHRARLLCADQIPAPRPAP
ncbi:hypothetical protein ACH41H_24740 [Streptomyces sp. NPDC020800]|uniref:hypothetical protein n=1 Tax=Streptomyces sp. NPDC020800 TaxID=3365092 RepID=UPI0037B82564